jgi:hypothetical protein
LGELGAILDHEPAHRFDGHLRRRDFSRWIAGVFGDHQLAAEVSRIEAHYREMPSSEAAEEIVREIKSRYDLNPLSVRA